MSYSVLILRHAQRELSVHDQEEYFAFPGPESLDRASIEDLRALKLSERKAEYIKGIAAAALDDSGWLEGLPGLEDEAVVSRVTELRGVGQVHRRPETPGTEHRNSRGEPHA